jgi:hypothetical protein
MRHAPTTLVGPSLYEFKILRIADGGESDGLRVSCD